MRILADENMLGAAIELLRSRGHDVRWIRTDNPGASDEAVIRLAMSENRLLITFDKDFGELVFRGNLQPTQGVVLFRYEPRNPDDGARVIMRVLEARMDWSGHFSVFEPGRIRMTPFPPR